MMDDLKRAHKVLKPGVTHANCLLGPLDWRQVLHGGRIGHLQKKATSCLVMAAL